MTLGVVQQKTIKAAMPCRGVGVHSGARVAMTLHPAPTDSGIVFRRSDRGGACVAANWRNVQESPLCTTLTNREGVSVATVEHLLAAFAGIEIDNVTVELDGPEVPVMDGSAEPFLFLIERAGIVEQDVPRRAIKVLKPVRVADEDCAATLEPDVGFNVSFEIDFSTQQVRRQDIALSVDAETFKADLARARTFGFLEDVERLRSAGLARGGSLDNAVVVSDGKILNAGGLRFADEFVRHKVLDAVGDLYLAGGPLVGHFRGVRSGHAMNRRLLEALFADRSAWCRTTLGAADLAEAANWANGARVARA
ncbi:MAG TPA: UDP-3-O-acyl-N-acetylglucosamine deacetylase [Stellaceae bacterium]|nr:UDP-3-O-acyl-N-acetylglucosamine deacetylase [Stellaceae bacterium]